MSDLYRSAKKMIYVAAYILVGLVAYGLVACTGTKSKHELPMSLLFDPVWPLAFLWPLWIVVVLVERSFPKDKEELSPAPHDAVGKTGIVVSALRPLGRVRLGDQHVDARSDGRIIPEGATVRIVSRSMAEFVVEEAPNSERSALQQPTPDAG